MVVPNFHLFPFLPFLAQELKSQEAVLLRLKRPKLAFSQLAHAFPPPLQELKTKKRYGRVQKSMGDHCLLAGSPLDAQEHYSVAADLARTCADWIWLGEALSGFASAKVGLGRGVAFPKHTSSIEV